MKSHLAQLCVLSTNNPSAGWQTTAVRWSQGTPKHEGTFKYRGIRLPILWYILVLELVADTGSTLALVVTCQDGLHRILAPPEDLQPPFDDVVKMIMMMIMVVVMNHH